MKSSCETRIQAVETRFSRRLCFQADDTMTKICSKACQGWSGNMIHNERSSKGVRTVTVELRGGGLLKLLVPRILPQSTHGKQGKTFHFDLFDQSKRPLRTFRSGREGCCALPSPPAVRVACSIGETPLLAGLSAAAPASSNYSRLIHAGLLSPPKRG